MNLVLERMRFFCVPLPERRFRGSVRSVSGVFCAPRGTRIVPLGMMSFLLPEFSGCPWWCVSEMEAVTPSVGHVLAPWSPGLGLNLIAWVHAELSRVSAHMCCRWQTGWGLPSASVPAAPPVYPGTGGPAAVCAVSSCSCVAGRGPLSAAFDGTLLLYLQL